MSRVEAAFLRMASNFLEVDAARFQDCGVSGGIVLFEGNG
ncbi:hypothetical protein SDC9_152113 [bioreactor metagenome]|uniref:Uncharacterized protein n=1 Tax=bioreactor metagenome TaxID=1076179 RepID=A0A645ES63_9ZZZZ